MKANDRSEEVEIDRFRKEEKVDEIQQYILRIRKRSFKEIRKK
jgi:hypothetical protein